MVLWCKAFTKAPEFQHQPSGNVLPYKCVDLLAIGFKNWDESYLGEHWLLWKPKLKHQI